MIRGTTPTNIFNVDADLREATAVYITYQQDGKTVIEKTINDISIEQKTLTTTLTQAETLALDEREVRVQIRAKFPDETAMASNIIVTHASAILKDGEI